MKVLRPGVEEAVALDLEISFRLLFWLNVLFRNHHVRALTNVVREFSVRVREEMDFRQEAENMEVFRRFFPDEGRVRVPKVWEEHTRRRVLVMEYCSGTKIDRLQDRFESGELDFTELMETLTGLYLRTMMVDGFLHADPHPGNLLVQDDGRIVLLDWGMMLRVPKWTRESILNLALAVERGEPGRDHQRHVPTGDDFPGGFPRGDPGGRRGDHADHGAGPGILPGTDPGDRARRSSTPSTPCPSSSPRSWCTSSGPPFSWRESGIGTNPSFDGLGLVRRVIGEFRADIQRTTGREPGTLARDLLAEAQTTLGSVRDLLLRAQREELRVRVHPRDIQGQERILHLQARRLLLSIFATGTAVITAIMFIAIRELLASGGGIRAFPCLCLLWCFSFPRTCWRTPSGMPEGSGRMIDTIEMTAGQRGSSRTFPGREEGGPGPGHLPGGERTPGLSGLSPRGPGDPPVLQDGSDSRPPGSGEVLPGGRSDRAYRDRVGRGGGGGRGPHLPLLGRGPPGRSDPDERPGHRSGYLHPVHGHPGIPGGVGDHHQRGSGPHGRLRVPRVLVETVGVGQTELEITGAADTVVVILVPESGDAIQAMKAGLMEIADIFVVNKADRPGADRLVKDLKLALHSGRGRP